MPLISAPRQAALKPHTYGTAAPPRTSAAAAREQRGVTTGMPLYLQTQLPVSQPNDPAEREADGMADRIMRMSVGTVAPPLAGAFARGAASQSHSAQGQALIQRAADPAATAPAAGPAAMQTSGSGGSALGASVRAFMEPRFGADFSRVRVHAGADAAQMNRALGARAFTVGQDIYYGSSSATADMSLTAHELAHVMQQSSGMYRPAIQREILPSYDSGNGIFDVTTVLGGSNLPITITFTPDIDAPYSNQIGLIQIVRLTDVAGANVEPQSLPAARAASLRTQATDAPDVTGGFFTDVLHNDAPAHGGVGTDARAGSALPPQYPFGNDPAQPNPRTPGLSRPSSSGARGATVGYKRSDDPADIKAAQLTDAPGYAAPNPANADIDFEFETVAKGEDSATIFGALHWGFEIRGSVVQNEHASVSAAQSATFDAALERHRDFYVHEPVIFYFDFDDDTLNAEEDAKIDDELVAYLARFPDVRVTPTGFADRSGGRSQYNLDLSLRRAQAVEAALLAKGIPAAQVSGSRRSGATERFTPDAITDQDLDANRRGNRRVVLTFRHVPRPTGRGARARTP